MNIAKYCNIKCGELLICYKHNADVRNGVGVKIKAETPVEVHDLGKVVCTPKTVELGQRKSKTPDKTTTRGGLQNTTQTGDKRQM